MNHTTIVQQQKTNETHEWKKKTKHNNDKELWNTAMTHSSEKQESCMNENNNEQKKGKPTFVQQSYNNRSTMKTNKTRMKHENETQQ